ncbi:hypothetical protein DFH27DRAFT_617892 [Peziza echinospora]|nr:hypothetical protein DFH27DRAFT_617892 [Peziza echinospora]
MANNAAHEFATSSLEIKLLDLHEQCTPLGFKGIVHAAAISMSYGSPLTKLKAAKATNDGSVQQMMDTVCNLSLKKGSVKLELSQMVLLVISEHLMGEINELGKLTEMSLPAKAFIPQKIRNFDILTIIGEMQKKSPILSGSLASVGGIGRQQKKMESGESRDAGGVGGKPIRNKTLIVCAAISMLSYANMKNTNSLQGMMGYFLFAANAGKRVVDVLHKLGSTMSYEAVLLILRRISDTSKEIYCLRVLKEPVILYFDHMNFYNNMKTMLLHNRPMTWNYTAAYLQFPKVEVLNPDGTMSNFEGQFSGSYVNREKARLLMAKDLELSVEVVGQFKSTEKVYIGRILKKYCPDAMGYALTKGQLIPANPEVWKLPVERSDVHSLPTMDLDEAKISDVVLILKRLMKELNLSVDTLEDFVVLFQGDWLTVRDIVLAMYQRQEDEVEERFTWIEPVAGLFYLEMNVVRIMLKTH